MLRADDLERLVARGWVREAQTEGERPADCRWTERHWGAGDGRIVHEEGEDSQASFELDESEEAIEASKSGRRSQGGRRGARWKGHRARRVQRSLARAWRRR